MRWWWCIAGVSSAGSLVASGEEALHLIDVPALVCGGPSTTTVHLDAMIKGPNATAPRILTFYRTSLAGVAVSFSLKGASGETVLKNTTVQLSELEASQAKAPPRRLQEEAAEGHGCEEFFLNDGRDPVDLPDTWAEARHAFRGICEDEGVLAEECTDAEAAAFHSQPRGEVPLVADAGFCRRLAQQGHDLWGFVLASPGFAQARRLKAGGGFGHSAGGGRSGRYAGTAGGSYAARNGRWGSPLYPGLGAYGFGTAFLAMSYSRGFATTSYGYAGHSAHGPRKQNDTTVRAGPIPVTVEHEKSIHSRAITHCLDASNQSCVDGRVAAAAAGFVQWQLDPKDEFVRDDLMVYGFQARRDQSPYALTITAVAGTDYATTRICAPTGKAAADAARSASPWRPPPREDLFVTLTEVESLPKEEEDFAGVLGTVLLLLCVAGVLVMCCRQERHPEVRDVEWRRPSPRAGGKAAGNHPKVPYMKAGHEFSQQKVPAQCYPAQEE